MESNGRLCLPIFAPSSTCAWKARRTVSSWRTEGGWLRVPRDGIDWLDAELNSLFIRDRIGGPRCVSGHLRAEVCLVDPKLPVKFRGDRGADVRRNTRRGHLHARPHL